jgi:hypothetical protein
MSRVDEVPEYRRHAERCRELAAKADGPEKKYLVEMAVEWEKRADEAEGRGPFGKG